MELISLRQQNAHLLTQLENPGTESRLHQKLRRHIWKLLDFQVTVSAPRIVVWVIDAWNLRSSWPNYRNLPALFCRIKPLVTKGTGRSLLRYGSWSFDQCSTLPDFVNWRRPLPLSLGRRERGIGNSIFVRWIAQGRDHRWALPIQFPRGIIFFMMVR